MKPTITIDANLISYLEGLSCLTLSEGEKQRLAGDLAGILERMDRLSEINAEGVVGRSHPFDNVNGFRADEIQEPPGQEAILKNAPEKGNGMFIAPNVAGVSGAADA